jgi:hypothetical protein
LAKLSREELIREIKRDLPLLRLALENANLKRAQKKQNSDIV